MYVFYSFQMRQSPNKCMVLSDADFTESIFALQSKDAAKAVKESVVEESVGSPTEQQKALEFLEEEESWADDDNPLDEGEEDEVCHFTDPSKIALCVNIREHLLIDLPPEWRA